MLLYPEDVEAFTAGRLAAASADTERLLDSAVAAARRFCGWHVTPVRTEQLVLDGPGGPDLVLPTLHLVSVSAITENGVALTLADLQISATGRIRKTSGQPWTSAYAGITVTLTHGWDDAPDFDAAVLAAVDAASLTVGQGGLTRKKVDDVEYQWAAAVGEWLPTAQLAPFRLEPRP